MTVISFYVLMYDHDYKEGLPFSMWNYNGLGFTIHIWLDESWLLIINCMFVMIYTLKKILKL